MKVSIKSAAQLYAAFAAIEAAKETGSDVIVLAAFAQLAEAADGMVCAGILGRFRRRPSSMGVAEFLVFLQDDFPRLVGISAEDRALIEKLKLVSTTPQ